MKLAAPGKDPIVSRILVVDDDPEIRSTLKKLLERYGHDVVIAADGRGAETALSQSSFDLMVTDIVMPDQDGLEVIRITRAAHPKLPIIAISGGGQLRTGNYLRLAKAMGAMTAIEKPFEFDAFLREVNAALEPAR
jgi:DNA-binding NtrC family response regulator